MGFKIFCLFSPKSEGAWLIIPNSFWAFSSQATDSSSTTSGLPRLLLAVEFSTNFLLEVGKISLPECIPDSSSILEWDWSVRTMLPDGASCFNSTISSFPS